MASRPPNTTKAGTSPSKLMMITRHQSALLHKRQLREKDRSMKKITRLLKGPSSLKTASANTTNVKTHTAKTSPKNTKVKIVKNSMEIVKDIRKAKKINNSDSVQIQIDTKEYYPSKLKRKLDTKKVWLIPKSHLKVIGNKRKLGIPQKDIKTSQTFDNITPRTLITSNSNSTKNESNPIRDKTQNLTYSGLSTAEMVQFTEITEDLSDEDLLEILTCPSPVWWEDPPDSCFIEDPIFTRTDLQENKTIVKKTRVSLDKEAAIEDSKETSFTTKELVNNKNITIDSKIAETNDIIISDIELKQCDEKFIKKRSKLENLLGNIKRKRHDITKELPSSVIENRAKVNREEIIKLNPKLTAEIIELDSDVINIDDKEINQEKEKTLYNSSTNFKRKCKTSSESTDDLLSDHSVQDDDILNVLENMTIPIEPEESEILQSPINLASIENSNEFHGTVENKSKVNKNEFNSSFETSNTTGLIPDENYENIDIEDYLQVSLLMKIDNGENDSAESKTNMYKENSVTTQAKDNETEDIGSKDAKTLDSTAMVNQTEDINEITKKPTCSNSLIEEVPKNLPPLQRIPRPNLDNNLIFSPTSLKSVTSSDATVESSLNQEIDTISDTNIQFLTDEDVDYSGNEVQYVSDNSKDNENAINDKESESYKEILSDKLTNEDENDASDTKNQFFQDSQTIENKSNLKIQSDVNGDNIIEKSVANSLNAYNETNVHANNMEYVVVYKILSDSENQEIEKKSEISKDTIVKNKNVNKNMDIFYKKCKNANHKCKNKRNINKDIENESENTDTSASTDSNDILNPETNRNTLITTDNEKENGELIFCKSCNPNARNSIIVPGNQSVKYCLKCSSIFDTENCEYCLTKAAINKTEINNVASKKNSKRTKAKHFTCDLCNFHANTKSKIRRHLSEHNFENISMKNWDHCYTTRKYKQLLEHFDAALPTLEFFFPLKMISKSHKIS